MLTQALADEVRDDVRRLKETQDKFLETYDKLCAHYGKPNWRQGKVEMVFHSVRREIVPIMEQSGMDAREVQALCAWAEKNEMRR
jgi:hypothetical protein